MNMNLSSPPGSLGRGRARRWLAALLVSGWVAAGCARTPAREGRAAGPAPGMNQVEIEAESFGFIPDRIRVKAGATLKIRVRNTSFIGHNLTILSPDGKVVKAVDLESGKPVEFSVRFPRKGVYTIYCDRFLHRTFGMKGAIEAD